MGRILKITASTILENLESMGKNIKRQPLLLFWYTSF